MAAEVTVVRGGRVVDPAAGLDARADVLIRDGIVAMVGASDRHEGGRTIDATGLVVAPGLIDVHVHLRQPGHAHKETVETGTAAAAAGGFTTVYCMPNTEPALDRPAVIRSLRDEIERRAVVRVHPIGAITRGRRGQEAVDFDGLAASGVVGFSDDGDTVTDGTIMRRALAASRRLGLPVMVHCEDKSLSGAGHMHEGEVSGRLGLAGIPAEAEEVVIARDIALARLTGGWLHLCHVSTGRGAAMARQARAEGLRVTAEVMPHHLLMTDEWVAGDRTLVNVREPKGAPGRMADPDTKVNPPLRSAGDAAALLRELKRRTFDLIATDHAPHAASEKRETDFARAAFGLSGLEFALPLMLALVRAGHLSLSDLVQLLSAAPARLWNLPGGTLRPGTPADLVVFDPDEAWTVDAAALQTKSANTPLVGMTLRGRVRWTLVGGKEKFVA